MSKEALFTTEKPRGMPAWESRRVENWGGGVRTRAVRGGKRGDDLVSFMLVYVKGRVNACGEGRHWS